MANLFSGTLFGGTKRKKKRVSLKTAIKRVKKAGMAVSSRYARRPRRSRSRYARY